MKNTIFHDTCILFIITLISGLALGGVYDITKGPIQEQKEKAEKAAYQVVLPEATEFTQLDEQQITDGNSSLQAEGYTSVVESVSEGINAEGVVGYVMKVTTPEGYGGDITISMGMDQNGMVTGVEMLSINETAGLGMKAKEDAFNDQYDGKQVDVFQVTKTGEAGDDKIDAISGATITTNAVTGAVNAGIAFYQQMNQ